MEKKRITDHDFPPPNLFVGSENNKNNSLIISPEVDAIKPGIFSTLTPMEVAHEEYFPFYLAATKSRHNRESGQMLRTTLLASIPPSCEAVQLNILSRHGSRFPSSSTHSELQSLLKKLKQSAPQANLTKYLTGFLTELKAQERIIKGKIDASYRLWQCGKFYCLVSF